MKFKKRKNLTPEAIDNTTEACAYEGVKYYPVFTSRRDGATNFSMRLFEIAPGKSTAKHKHSYEHEVYILSGDGFLLLDDKKIKIGKDDCFLIEPYEFHQLIGGENKISFICIVPNREKIQPD